MFKILKYSFVDLIRSRWTLAYMMFYMLLTFGFLALGGDISKAIISLMNVVLVLVPLIASIFGIIYYYNSLDFVELLLAQPVKRRDIFIGQYLGIAISLSGSLILGVGIPFLVYGILGSIELVNFLTLMLTGTFLSFIFSAIAFLIALRNENKVKGFGLSILVWLFFAVIYDGIFLLALFIFKDYPLENVAIGGSIFNPIDLSRTLILLKLDVSALMGYTGSVFNKFLGSNLGIFLATGALCFWVFIPVWRMLRLSRIKDF